MLDDSIEILTRLMLKDVYNDKKSNCNEKIIMSKADLYKFCIKLIKLIKQIEEMEEYR